MTSTYLQRRIDKVVSQEGSLFYLEPLPLFPTGGFYATMRALAEDHELVSDQRSFIIAPRLPGVHHLFFVGEQLHLVDGEGNTTISTPQDSRTLREVYGKETKLNVMYIHPRSPFCEEEGLIKKLTA